MRAEKQGTSRTKRIPMDGDLLSAPRRHRSAGITCLPWTPRPSGVRCSDDASLLVACRCGDQFALRRAMVQRLNEDAVNVQDEGGKTALSHLCTSGNIHLLELLLLVPLIDVNLADKEGNAPLHFAAQAGHLDIMNRLITIFKGLLIIDLRNHRGMTPLMKASLQGRSKCARALLNAGANPCLRDPGRGLNALEWAAFCGRKSTEKVIGSYMKTGKGFRATAARWLQEPNLSFTQKVKRLFTGGNAYNFNHHLFKATSTVVLPAAPSALDGPSPSAAVPGSPAVHQQMPHVYVSAQTD